jgi:hypothetical protein
MCKEHIVSQIIYDILRDKKLSFYHQMSVMYNKAPEKTMAMIESREKNNRT